MKLVKVNKVVSVHAMTSYRVSGDTAAPILNLGIKCGELSVLHLCRFTPGAH
jgi:hypothetical protein